MINNEFYKINLCCTAKYSFKKEKMSILHQKIKILNNIRCISKDYKTEYHSIDFFYAAMTRF